MARVTKKPVTRQTRVYGAPIRKGDRRGTFYYDPARGAFYSRTTRLHPRSRRLDLAMLLMDHRTAKNFRTSKDRTKLYFRSRLVMPNLQRKPQPPLRALPVGELALLSGGATLIVANGGLRVIAISATSSTSGDLIIGSDGEHLQQEGYDIIATWRWLDV